jgi:hypothetical protein
MDKSIRYRINIFDVIIYKKNMALVKTNEIPNGKNMIPIRIRNGTLQ